MGCRTTGCGLALLIVFLAFWGMLSYAEREAKKLKTVVRARSGAEAKDDLALLYSALSRYAAAHGGRLPADLGAEGALHAALLPEFVSSEEAVVNRRDGMDYGANPRLAGAEWAKATAPGASAQTPLAWEATFSERTAKKWVLFADGSLREVDGDSWARLLPGLTPAAEAFPAPSPVPSPSPRPTPRPQTTKPNAPSQTSGVSVG